MNIAALKNFPEVPQNLPDEFGNDVLEERYVYTGSGYERIA